MDSDFYKKTNEIAAQLRKPRSNMVLEKSTKSGPRLTSRNMDVISFMRMFLSDNDRLPAMKDISDYFGWSSQNSADEHVKKLMHLGVIERSGACWYRFSRKQTQHETYERLTACISSNK